MAPPLLTPVDMPEPENTPDEIDSHVERHVVYETVSSSTTKNSGITIAIVAVIAIALIVWIAMKVF